MTEVNTKPKLIDAALAHLALERAAACVLPVPDTDPPLFVAVGPAPAIVKLLQEEASPELPDLDRLEALARAADPHGAVHLITHYRNSADTKAEEAWRQAATPAAMLALIALARRAQPEGEAPQAELHVEARECSSCGHVGINDSSDTLAACHNCEWSGPSPTEDHCPGCAQGNCMGAACPRCSAIYKLLVEANIAAPAAQQAASGAQAAIAQSLVEVELDESEGGHHD